MPFIWRRGSIIPISKNRHKGNVFLLYPSQNRRVSGRRLKAECHTSKSTQWCFLNRIKKATIPNPVFTQNVKINKHNSNQSFYCWQVFTVNVNVLTYNARSEKHPTRTHTIQDHWTSNTCPISCERFPSNYCDIITDHPPHWADPKLNPECPRGCCSFGGLQLEQWAGGGEADTSPDILTHRSHALWRWGWRLQTCCAFLCSQGLHEFIACCTNIISRCCPR